MSGDGFVESLLAAPVGVGLLAAAPHLTGLVELNLAGNAFNEAAARELIASPHLNRLRKLNLFDNLALLKGPAVAALTERFGEGVVKV